MVVFKQRARKFRVRLGRSGLPRETKAAFSAANLLVRRGRKAFAA